VKYSFSTLDFKKLIVSKRTVSGYNLVHILAVLSFMQKMYGMTVGCHEGRGGRVKPCTLYHKARVTLISKKTNEKKRVLYCVINGKFCSLYFG